MSDQSTILNAVATLGHQVNDRLDEINKTLGDVRETIGELRGTQEGQAREIRDLKKENSIIKATVDTIKAPRLADKEKAISVSLSTLKKILYIGVAVGSFIAGIFGLQSLFQ